jgi:hypothetical protein
MNIKNTMCRLSELTPVQKHNLIAAMPNSDYWQWASDECFIGFDESGASGTWESVGHEDIVTYTEMMQLLGKTMQFTKSDLKAGVHFVKDRDGFFYAICRNTFCGKDNLIRLSSVNDDLININGNPGMDIVEVSEIFENRNMSSHLQGLGLSSVWKRTEQTPAQKEMEVLQVKMDELQEQMKVVKAKL